MNRNNPCCICGLALATQDSDSVQWARDIRALCKVENKTVLSDIGSVDGDTSPYNVVLSHYGPRRFSYRCSDSSGEFCYPFHATCWSIVDEIDHEGFSNSLDALFDIFESGHYVRKVPRCLNWGQDLYLRDIVDEVPGRADLLELTDPSIFFDPLQMQPSCFPRSTDIDTLLIGQTSALEARGLPSLPEEILVSIFCILDYADVLCLLASCKGLYRMNGRLPNSFWKSRFWIFNETAFASSIRPSYCSYKDWYFAITRALRKGPYRLNLLNRKRIWKIGLDLISTIRALSNPGRQLFGHNIVPPASFQGPTANCMATKYAFGACRQLKQVHVSFENRRSGLRLCDITPSYILISGRRLISGLTFRFSDGTIHDLGYVTKGNNEHTLQRATLTIASKYLWLVCSHFGLEATKTDSIGQTKLEYSTPTPENLIAITRWPTVDLTGVSISLDALRIVRISLENSQNIKRPGLDGALWTLPYPEFSPVMHEEDIASLYQLQRQAFAPASYICIEPMNGHLITVIICSQLGLEAGIAGIRLCYSTGIEKSWGSVDNTASLAFFLAEGDSLTGVDVYKTGSVVRHLRFTTSYGRTSELMPQMSTQHGAHIKYTASGSFTGFCGCITNSAGGASSLKQLNCFGVIGATSEISFQPSPSAPANRSIASVPLSRELPLGGIRDHGEHRSRLKITKRVCSIQASVLKQPSEYRRMGQVTGLLFRFENEDGKGCPELIGQWTNPGEICHLEEGEQILSLDISEMKPRCRIPSRQGLLQVGGMTVVTDRRRISWNRSTESGFVVELTAEQKGPMIREISWEFNAIFDRVKYN
ncbi:hypothetical protein BKA61DRAFT_597333 [Leptodontidium sp. MPI-SDFR-AT-0119]|nr:hypothetical protein BKA61DRAFT_597333 [Leptodontidium sp. MPI-SDFR-AT-0119]